MLVFFVSAISSLFAMEVKTIDESYDNYSMKILAIENFAQAKFILTIPQVQFERSTAFNTINARIRQYQVDGGFNSYFRICNDVVQYNSKTKTVNYISDVQFRSSIYTKNEFKE